MKSSSTQFDNSATIGARGENGQHEHRFLTVDNLAAMLPVPRFRER